MIIELTEIIIFPPILIGEYAYRISDFLLPPILQYLIFTAGKKRYGRCRIISRRKEYNQALLRGHIVVLPLQFFDFPVI